MKMAISFIFVPAITKFQLSSIPDPIDLVLCFKMRKIFYMFMGTLWVCFLKISFGIVQFSLLRYYQCLHALISSHKHHPFRLIPKLMKTNWKTYQLLRMKAMKMMIQIMLILLMLLSWNLMGTLLLLLLQKKKSFVFAKNVLSGTIPKVMFRSKFYYVVIVSEHLSQDLALVFLLYLNI